MASIYAVAFNEKRITKGIMATVIAHSSQPSQPSHTGLECDGCEQAVARFMNRYSRNSR